MSPDEFAGGAGLSSNLKAWYAHLGIDDLKKLDLTSREALAIEIKEKATAWCVAFVEVEEIDTINIYWAGLLAMRRAVEGLGLSPQHLLIEAKRLKEIAIPQQAIIRGDPNPPASRLHPFSRRSRAMR